MAADGTVASERSPGSSASPFRSSPPPAPPRPSPAPGNPDPTSARPVGSRSCPERQRRPAPGPAERLPAGSPSASRLQRAVSGSAPVPLEPLEQQTSPPASSMATGGPAPTTREPRSPPSQRGPPTEVFAYQEGDFVLQGVEWPAIRNGLLSEGHNPSPFDCLLQRGWKDRLEKGLFRYHLGELQTRVLPGPVGFVAQLNVERGVERRPPQEVQSVRQRFDPQLFNFSKIQPEEVLFCMSRGCPLGPEKILVVINVSPLEFGHVLLIPSPGLALPQILMPGVLRFGLDAVLLSAHPGFRVGFNSLGAFASVNHLHLHGFYLNWVLLVESAPCKPLLPESRLYLLQGVPAPGFLFYNEGQQLEELAGQIVQVTNYLVKKEIAHNLFVTRGAAPEGPVHTRARPGIRIIIWPRRACFGAKEKSAFNVALCELAGHLPIKTTQDFEVLTEASAILTIQKYLLSDVEFAQLQSELVALLREQ